MTARVGLPPWLPTAGFVAIAAALGGVAGIDPNVAVGISVALAFVLLTLTQLRAGLIAFVLLAFLEFLFPGGYFVSVTKIAGAVLALAWVAKIATSRQRDDFFSSHPAAAYALIAFLGWGAISVLWSASSDETWLELSRYILVIALFVITYSALRSRRDAFWLFGAFLVGTVITTVYGLVNRPSASPEELVRVASSVGNPNVLAMVLVAGLALSFGAVIACKHAPLARAAASLTALLCLISLVFTGSRSGVVSLALALITWVLVAGRWRAQAVAGTLAIALASLALFVTLAPPEIRERIVQTTPGQASASSEGRTTLWQIAWRMVEDRPLTGVGLGSFQTSSVEYVLQPGTLGRTDQVIDNPEVVHNVYLQGFAETGAVGGLLLIALFGFPVACALRAAKNFERSGDLELEIMSRALVVALVGMLTSNFFASETFNKLLWLLLGTAVALLAISRGSLAGGDQRATRAGSARGEAAYKSS